MYVAEAITPPSPMRQLPARPENAGSSLTGPAEFDAVLRVVMSPTAVDMTQPAVATPDASYIDALVAVGARILPDAPVLLPVSGPDANLSPGVQPLNLATPSSSAAPSGEPGERLAETLVPPNPAPTVDASAPQGAHPAALAPIAALAEDPVFPPALSDILTEGTQAGRSSKRADRMDGLPTDEPAEPRAMSDLAGVATPTSPAVVDAGIAVALPVPRVSQAGQEPSLPSNPRAGVGIPISATLIPLPAPPNPPAAGDDGNPAVSLPTDPPVARATGVVPPSGAPTFPAEPVSQILPVNPKAATPDGLPTILRVPNEVDELQSSAVQPTTMATDAGSARVQTLPVTAASLPQTTAVQATPVQSATFSPLSPFSTEHQEWQAGLVERVVHQLTASGQSIDLTLAPENLGRVHIRLELQEGAAQVFFTTETSEAAKLLAANESHLSELFSRAGLTLAGQDTMREGTARNASPHQQATPRQRQPSQNNPTPSHHPQTGIINLVA